MIVMMMIMITFMMMMVVMEIPITLRLGDLAHRPNAVKKNTPVKPRQGQPMHPGKPQIQHPGLLTQQQQHQLANQRMGAAVAGQLPPKSGQSGGTERLIFSRLK